MAKYAYKFSCGHGEGSVALFGKGSEREKKLQWYANTYTCPACFKVAAEKADETAPKTAKLVTREGDTHVWLELQVSGQLKENSEKLRALGFSWREAGGGLGAYLSMDAPKKALLKNIRVSSLDEASAWVRSCANELIGIGYTVTNGMSDLDASITIEKFKKIEKINAENAAAKTRKNEFKKANPPPKRPSALDVLEEKTRDSGWEEWNGKIYGGDKYGYTAYINNERHAISSADKKEIDAWREKLTEWREKLTKA